MTDPAVKSALREPVTPTGKRLAGWYDERRPNAAIDDILAIEAEAAAAADEDAARLAEALDFYDRTSLIDPGLRRRYAQLRSQALRLHDERVTP
jgi:hypothetical protein